MARQQGAAALRDEQHVPHPAGGKGKFHRDERTRDGQAILFRPQSVATTCGTVEEHRA